MSYLNIIKTLQFVKCINPDNSKRNQMLLAKTTGNLLVWKKVRKYFNSQKRHIHTVIPLVLPKNTLIVCTRYYFKSKCNKMRAEKAISLGNGYSHWKPRFKYTKDVLIKPNSFSKDPQICSNGIHFFLTEKEAQKYYIY